MHYCSAFVCLVFCGPAGMRDPVKDETAAGCAMHGFRSSRCARVTPDFPFMIRGAAACLSGGAGGISARSNGISQPHEIKEL